MRTIAIDTEIWKSIFGHSSYEVSSMGRVRRNSRILKPYSNIWSRLQVDLYSNGVRRKVFIHTLVLESFFIGPKQYKSECAHLNGKSWDNRFSNLKWATHKENESHKYTHKTINLGEKRFGAKLTEADVINIRKLYNSGVFGYELAEMFGVNKSIISRVINKRIWSHV